MGDFTAIAQGPSRLQPRTPPCHRRARTRSSWRLACQSGRLGPDTVGPAQAGPCVAPSPTALRPSSPAMQLTRPLARSPRPESPSIAGGGTATHRRLGRSPGGAGRRAPGDCIQVETRMLVTAGHRRHVTRWPLMTSSQVTPPARQRLGATRNCGPD